MPQGFQHGETPKGAQGQEEGEIAQPKRRWWPFGRGKQDQPAQPIPASVAAQEPSVAPVEPAPQVEQQIQPKLTVEEIRKGLKDQIEILTPEETRLKQECKRLEEQQNKKYEELGELEDKSDCSLEELEKITQLSLEIHAIEIEKQQADEELADISVLITGAQTTLLQLPKELSVADEAAKKIAELGRATDIIIEAKSQEVKVAGADIAAVKERQVKWQATQMPQPQKSRPHDPVREGITSRALAEARARKAQKATSNKAGDEATSAGGKQSGVAH